MPTETLCASELLAVLNFRPAMQPTPQEPKFRVHSVVHLRLLISYV